MEKEEIVYNEIMPKVQYSAQKKWENAADKSEEEVQEDEAPLSLPKTGNKDSMIYIILGMATVVFGIKKYRK